MKKLIEKVKGVVKGVQMGKLTSVKSDNNSNNSKKISKTNKMTKANMNPQKKKPLHKDKNPKMNPPAQNKKNPKATKKLVEKPKVKLKEKEKFIEKPKKSKEIKAPKDLKSKPSIKGKEKEHKVSKENLKVKKIKMEKEKVKEKEEKSVKTDKKLKTEKKTKMDKLATVTITENEIKNFKKIKKSKSKDLDDQLDDDNEDFDNDEVDSISDEHDDDEDSHGFDGEDDDDEDDDGESSKKKNKKITKPVKINAKSRFEDDFVEVDDSLETDDSIVDVDDTDEVEDTMNHGLHLSEAAQLKRVKELGEKIAEEVTTLTEDYSLVDIREAIKGLDFFNNSDLDECQERYCENLATTLGHCRFHYIKNWKTIRKKRQILSEGKLQSLIEELVQKYPPKIIETIVNDLNSDKQFFKILKDLNIDTIFQFDEVSTDIDSDDDITMETRNFSAGRGGFEDDDII
jgi:hypothetical protein